MKYWQTHEILIFIWPKQVKRAGKCGDIINEARKRSNLWLDRGTQHSFILKSLKMKKRFHTRVPRVPRSYITENVQINFGLLLPVISSFKACRWILQLSYLSNLFWAKKINFEHIKHLLETRAIGQVKWRQERGHPTRSRRKLHPLPAQACIFRGRRWLKSDVLF